MQNIKRVLVICGIETSCSGLAHDAATLAAQMGAELFLVTIIYNPFGLKGLSLPMPSLEEDYRKLIEKIRKEMQEIIIREKHQGVAIQEQIREGEPVHEILTAIRERNIDLLVLPAHQESWLEYFLFGGENKALFKKMPCSILFVKSEPKALPEEEEEEKEE